MLRDEPATLSEYRFPPGAEDLRKILARRYYSLGVKLGADAVVTTGGAIDAIGLALSTVAASGEIVAVETPGYFGILQLVRSLGYKILEIPLDPEQGLTPEFPPRLAQICRQNQSADHRGQFCQSFGNTDFGCAQKGTGGIGLGIWCDDYRG
ncbi:MAG: hypothetical protein NVV73_04135 [Cellvibrionaceae bacterium]|nr:hypothetical protein [Cellvibrionaceae bacterium]